MNKAMPRKKGLREGFTTGTAAAAAAVAACALLCSEEGLPGDFANNAGASASALVYSVALPPIKFAGDDSGGEYLSVRNSSSGNASGVTHLNIPLSFCRKEPVPDRPGQYKAVAGVIKDAGDDPDVTHEALIEAEVMPLELFMASAESQSLATSPPIVMPLGIHIFAGSGVGRVTLPGLPVAVGEAAINPEPRKQIAAAVWEQRRKSPLWWDTPLAVIIRVRDGAGISQKTLNPRLGIVGGISILGTHGIVRPFSHEAWEEAVRQSLRVCKALSIEGVALCTGRRSEELVRHEFPLWPEQAFIQAADYVSSALSEAGRLGFKQVVWACFWGKLVKLAQGLPNTHARSAPLDLNFLADESALFSESLAEKVRNANTAMEALAYIQECGEPCSIHLIQFVGQKALAQAQIWLGKNSAIPQLRLLCFDSQGVRILSL